MGIYAWGSFGSIQKATRTPRLTVRCEYPDMDMSPTEVTFGLAPSYGIHSARDAHDWFLLMMRSHDEFVVETDRAGESPLSFWAFCRRVSLWQNQRSLGPKGRVTWGTSRVSR